jgi:hypothetical protein
LSIAKRFATAMVVATETQNVWDLVGYLEPREWRLVKTNSANKIYTGLAKGNPEAVPAGSQ